MKKTFILTIILVVVLILGLWLSRINENSPQTIKIGLISDFSGAGAYWGESTKAGAELAREELKAKGISLDIVYEDYQLDPKRAITAAEKLVSIGKVDLIYAEFNPAAIAVGSYLKDKKIPAIFVAAVTSPLAENQYVLKTYLDYKTGCRAVAEKFKEEGIQRIGALKINLEAGELCLEGVRDAYPDDVIVETYNLGETDFRTQFSKLRAAGVSAIITVGFEGDVSNMLKLKKDLSYQYRLGVVDDLLTDKVKNDFADQIKGSWTFGFADTDSDFVAKLNSANPEGLGTNYAAAIAYTHINQIARTLKACGDNKNCIMQELSGSLPDNTIGFQGFKNQMAEFEIKLRQY